MNIEKGVKHSTFQQYISIQTLDNGFRIGDLLFQNLRYADDTTLITETNDDQNEMIQAINDKGKAASLLLKTKT